MRPVVIFGEALGSNLNPIPALGTYAAVQRLAGRPLDYPGGRSMIIEGVDADLLADALFWAATNSGCRNEIFNIANGDVFTMENLWPALADAFGMDVGERLPMSLAEEMPARQAEWAAVHERFGLSSPRDVTAFVGQSFLYADMLLGYGVEAPVQPALVSTIKVRQAGFTECMDTEDMMRKWVAHFQPRATLPTTQLGLARLNGRDVVHEQLGDALGRLVGDEVAHARDHLEAVRPGHELGGRFGGHPTDGAIGVAPHVQRGNGHGPERLGQVAGGSSVPHERGVQCLVIAEDREVLVDRGRADALFGKGHAERTGAVTEQPVGGRRVEKGAVVARRSACA